MQSTGVYRVDKAEKPPKKHRKLKRFLIFLLFLLICFGIFIYIKEHLKPHTVVHQSKPVITTITDDQKLKTWNEPDFVIKMPSTWTAVPIPPHTYHAYTWTSGETAGAEQLTVYEDTIPGNFSVNRVVIVHSEDSKVVLDGSASDNCEQYTISGAPKVGEFGVPAKWQGVEFYCDVQNQERDIIGTSSLEGPNIVTVTNDIRTSHKFLFTLDNENAGSPNYTVFYNAISSFEMK